MKSNEDHMCFNCGSLLKEKVECVLGREMLIPEESKASVGRTH